MPTKISGTDLAYFSVPKNACTSIKAGILAHNDPGMMAKLAAFRDLPLEQRPPAGVLPNGKPVRHVHDLYPTVPFKPRLVLSLYRYRWFCVIRDPIRRFLSGYTNRIEHNDDLKHTDPAVLKAAGLSRTPDLEEFIARLEQYCAINLSIRHHFQPTIDFLGTRPQRYDRVFGMQELDEISRYCAAAGAHIALPHLQTGGAKLKTDVLTAPMQTRLKAFYAADYRHWGAFF